MSRFPEVQRIESAIRSKQVHQLVWAVAYCESRLAFDDVPGVQPGWRDLLERVQDALEIARRDA